MHFFKTAVLATLSFSAIPSLAAITSNKLCQNLEGMTANVRVAQSSAVQITLANSLLYAVGLGPFPAIISCVGRTVDGAVSNAVQLATQAPYTVEAEAVAVANAFHDFVDEQIVMIETLITKAGDLGTRLLACGPTAVALASLRLQVGIFANALVTACPQAAARDLIIADRARVHVRVQVAIDAYTALRILRRNHARDLLTSPVQ
ncbi:hypothetical protein TWF694_005737 [Orbilia ellipsospora]|uniref:Uncharacterized protein n=1 Tax=Orbilia ellipsospora TaxID=2528407 RepID=A0AAV9WSY1_9PEZI